MKKLSELFDVTYGTKLDMNKMTPVPRSAGGINFVGRSSQRHGVSGTVARIPGIDPFAAGLISVSLGGSKLLSSFIQEREFYTAQNVAVLAPLKPLTFAQKMYVCMCIRHNRFRYSAFGREANRTLRYLPIPADFPAWLADANVQKMVASAAKEFEQLKIEDDRSSRREYGPATVEEIFDVVYGNSYELCNLQPDQAGINFVSRRKGNNGVSARVKHTGEEPFQPGSMSVALGGNVLETWVQPAPFYTGRDVAVLVAKRPMSLEHKVFYCCAIKCHQFRYSYGRQANRTLPAIKLPATPEWLKTSRLPEVQSALAKEVASLLSHQS